MGKIIVSTVVNWDVKSAVERVMEYCPDLQKRVFLKANMYSFPYKEGITTNPQVITEVANYLTSRGHQVYFGDITREKVIDPVHYFEGYDMPEDAKFIHLNKINSYNNKKLGGYSFYMPRFLDYVDIINIPVLKCHSEALLTCAIKNCMGLIPKEKDRENIHNKGLDKGIKSLYEVNKRLIKYNVVDSIFVMEGNGPIKGDVKEGNAIFGGRDAECVDSFASTLIDIDEVPGYLETLKDYVLEGDDLGIRLKGPNLLSDKYYTGKPSLGFLGVFATMLDDIIFALGKNINFVFRGGRPKKNNINIGVNVPGLDHFVSGNPPSRRDIRKVLGVGLEKAISDINYHNELAREDYDET